jgi:hypothetical protein
VGEVGSSSWAAMTLIPAAFAWRICGWSVSGSGPLRMMTDAFALIASEKPCWKSETLPCEGKVTYLTPAFLAAADIAASPSL